MNANLDGLKVGTSGQTSFIGWRKILPERYKFGSECLVNDEKLVQGKLVCGVMQKIAFGVVC